MSVWYKMWKLDFTNFQGCICSDEFNIWKYVPVPYSFYRGVSVCQN